MCTVGKRQAAQVMVLFRALNSGEQDKGFLSQRPVSLWNSLCLTTAKASVQSSLSASRQLPALLRGETGEMAGSVLRPGAPPSAAGLQGVLGCSPAPEHSPGQLFSRESRGNSCPCVTPEIHPPKENGTI